MGSGRGREGVNIALGGRRVKDGKEKEGRDSRRVLSLLLSASTGRSTHQRNSNRAFDSSRSQSSAPGWPFARSAAWAAILYAMTPAFTSSLVGSGGAGRSDGGRNAVKHGQMRSLEDTCSAQDHAAKQRGEDPLPSEARAAGLAPQAPVQPRTAPIGNASAPVWQAQVLLGGDIAQQ